MGVIREASANSVYFSRNSCRVELPKGVLTFRENVVFSNKLDPLTGLKNCTYG